ncbi:MAG TPA: aminotransferase class I/II-fold pyridoxal phosphate-dependent enzyme, partial [Chthonomonadales bacterium]|nr:aminotransferase class I/II-fold pyridoxal phosphate-dependent enzyme [Chthonomonadales bacterium]
IAAKELAKHITARTKAILFGNPANPTGAVQSRDDLRALVALAERHNLYLVADEVYDRLVYDAEHVCLGSLPGARERSVILNGFSKSYAMTGWRIGYACAPARIASLMSRMHQYTMLCAPHLAQLAAEEALANAEKDVEAMVAEYNRRRRYFVQGLNRLGLPCAEPQGAFYVFPSIQEFGLGSVEFAEKLLMEQKVAVVPGNAFGAAGEGYIRCSYAASHADLEEALARIGKFVESRRTAGTPAQRSSNEPALSACAVRGA